MTRADHRRVSICISSLPPPCDRFRCLPSPGLSGEVRTSVIVPAPNVSRGPEVQSERPWGGTFAHKQPSTIEPPVSNVVFLLEIGRDRTVSVVDEILISPGR